MDKRKLYIFLAVIAIFAMIIAAAVLYFTTNSQNTSIPSKTSNTGDTQTIPPLRTRDELMKVILAQKPSLIGSDGKPRVEMTQDPQRLENNWYVVRLELLNVHTDPAKILLYDKGGDVSSVKLVLGPGTSFPDEVFTDINPKVPEVVRSEMNR